MVNVHTIPHYGNRIKHWSRTPGGTRFMFGLVLILVAIASFGLGRLSALSDEHREVLLACDRTLPGAVCNDEGAL